MTQAEGNVHIIKSNANSMFSTLKGSLLDMKPKSAVRKPAKQAQSRTIETKSAMLNKKLDRLTYSWNSTRGSGMHHQTRMKHFA